MKNIFKIFRKNDIGEPPWEYDFLANLDEGLYPLYLKKIFKYKTGEDLPIKKVGKDKWIIDKNKCKTFNQKIQWLKLNFCRVVSPDSISGVRTRSGKKSAETHKGVNNIMDTFGSGSKDFNEKNSGYGVTDLMRLCTDKVAVRDYVDEKIGSEYLKPVLQICDTFDEIDFEKLPNAFVIKCNHGCKWQYIIKNKDDFLNTPKLVDIVKKQMTGWLEQEFWPWNGFEMQYKGIEPKILIEPLMRDEIDTPCKEIMIYFISGMPKLVIKLHNDKEITFWDETLKVIENIFKNEKQLKIVQADEIIKQTIDLSKKLINNFKLVRVDWMLFQNKPYFEEMTFTPDSGFNVHFNIERLNNEFRVC